MFAGAAREAVFSNPAVIRKVNAEFIPVSVTAARMHQPPGDPETRLLWSAGRVAPAPQGMAVLNSDGRPLDWVLMFDSDQSVLDFLDHALRRFASNPDPARALPAQRYQRFPSGRMPDASTAADPDAPERHPAGAACPGLPASPPGTLTVEMIGRALDAGGRLSADTLHQSHHSQDRFEIPPPLQAQFAAATAGSGERRFPLPDSLARLLVSRAFLGQIDVKPIENPLGAPTRLQEYAFWVRRAENAAGHALFRLEGTSHLECGVAGRPGAPEFDHSIRLTWEGFIEMDGARMKRLILAAAGAERLRWQTPQPGAGTLPEVAYLPAGRAIDLDGKVRYGFLGSPAVR